MIWCHPAICWCLVTDRVQSRFFVVFYWFLSQGVVDWSQREGPGEEILGSILREKETGDKGPVMQIIPHPVSHFYSFTFLPCLIEVPNNFSIGDRLCPVRIIRGGSPRSQSCVESRLGVTTEFPSSCNNFTQPADTDRQPGSSHSLHITGQHENSDNTSSHIFPWVQTPDRVCCETWSGIRQKRSDIDIIICRQNLILGDSQPVQNWFQQLSERMRDVLNGQETDERV